MPTEFERLRALKNRGVIPGSPQMPGGAMRLDPEAADAINRVTSVQEGQVALAKQQLLANERQMEANVHAQKRANEQWRLVYALDVFKYTTERQCDTDLHEAVRACILTEFVDYLDPQTLQRLAIDATARARADAEEFGLRENIGNAREEEPAGFVEHEARETE